MIQDKIISVKKEYNNLLKLQNLFEAQKTLQEIAEHVIEKELPFSLGITVNLKVPEYNIVKEDPEDVLSRLSESDSPQEMMEILKNARQKSFKAEKSDKLLHMNLNSIGTITFLAILERLAKDIDSELNTIKTNPIK